MDTWLGPYEGSREDEFHLPTGLATFVLRGVPSLVKVEGDDINTCGIMMRNGCSLEAGLAAGHKHHASKFKLIEGNLLISWRWL